MRQLQSLFIVIGKFIPRFTQFGEKLLNFVWKTPFDGKQKFCTGKDGFFSFEFQEHVNPISIIVHEISDLG